MVAVYIPALVVYKRRNIVHDADIRKDHFEILRRDDLADQIFDLGHVFVGHLDARSGGNLHVHGELAGIGLREEGQAEKRIDAETCHKHAQQQRPA